MEYSVGSLADFISGANTPNKPKVLAKQFQRKSKKSKEMKPEVINKLKTEKRRDPDVLQNEVKKPKKVKVKKFINKVGLENGSEINGNNLHEITNEELKKKKKVVPVATESELEVPEKQNQTKAKGLAKVKKQKMIGEPQNEGENGFITTKNERKISKKRKGTGTKEYGTIKKQKAVEDPKKEEEIAVLKEENNKRTVFVGNLPITMNKIKLGRMFGKFGKVETIRFRSAPLADSRTPKKVAIIRKEFHKDRNSINGYVRFVERESAEKATKLNGKEIKDHHIRVKLCDDTVKPDQNKAIFLGNISFDAEEEELWKLFEQCGPIESVRLVRDPKTSVGKGFGYVNFVSADSVELALQMENVKLRNRELRISACDSRNKKKVKANSHEVFNKQGNKNKQLDVSKSTNDFQGKKSGDKKKKKLHKGNLQKKKISKKLAPKAT